MKTKPTLPAEPPNRPPVATDTQRAAAAARRAATILRLKSHLRAGKRCGSECRGG